MPDECHLEDDPQPCSHEIRHGTYYDPPEFCEEDAAPGSDFCPQHDPDALADALEAVAEARREERLYGDR